MGTYEFFVSGVLTLEQYAPEALLGNIDIQGDDRFCHYRNRMPSLKVRCATKLQTKTNELRSLYRLGCDEVMRLQYSVVSNSHLQT